MCGVDISINIIIDIKGLKNHFPPLPLSRISRLLKIKQKIQSRESIDGHFIMGGTCVYE
jgi:hypothetical protein